MVKHYHETVQAIHDDDALDKASAALSSVLGPQRHIIFQSLRDEEVGTLVHLLSPEASIRTNRTAAAAIVRWNSNIPEEFDYYDTYDFPDKVLIALAHAARRSVSSGSHASLATLATSTFLAAMVTFVVRVSDPGPEHPLPIRILGSKYVSLEHRSDSTDEVVLLMCDILTSTSPVANNQRWITTVAHLFRPATIRTSIVLQALCSLSPPNLAIRESITQILIEAKTTQSVIQEAFEVLGLVQDNSVQGLFMVDAIAHTGLTRDDFSDHELLRDLCVMCILNIVQDANFYPFHGGYWVAKALVEIPITEEVSTSDFRAALEHSIETGGFTQPPVTPWRVMGQNMPMLELAQLLHQMVETGPIYIYDFNLDTAIRNLRAGRDTW
jgi:hypothetical protein